jgi:hypothetical protein
LSGLDLGNPVIELVISFPKTRTILGLEFGSSLGSGRLVDMNVVVGITLADTVHEVMGLLEVVQSVEKDEVDHLGAGYLQLGQHIKGDQTCQTEGSGLEEVRE